MPPNESSIFLEPRCDTTLIEIRFASLRSATTELSDYAQITEMKERVHKMLAWKTLMKGKTSVTHGLQNISICREYRDEEERDDDLSFSLASPHVGYNRGNNLFLSLTLSLCTVTLYSHDTTTTTTTSLSDALPHLASSI